MNPHGLASLDLVQRFLAVRILPTVAGEMRSELRAAIKILKEASLELDGLYPILLKESNELLRLCIELQATTEIKLSQIDQQKLGTLDKTFKNGFMRLTELLRFHDELNALVAAQMTLLQAADHPNNRARLERFYGLLGEHASARLRWQAVFDQDGGTI